jgi:pyridoxamine 5'-phosphate oxidase
MKNLDENGITFFTNYESRKGQQLQDNPQASLLFFWSDIERQVRIEGMVGKVSKEESDAYFATRPEASRISATISPQSQEIQGREWLEERRQLAAGSMKLAVISRPVGWGGYRLSPDYFEFWQGRGDRLHDRIAYRHADSDWRIFRLAP